MGYYCPGSLFPVGPYPESTAEDEFVEIEVRDEVLRELRSDSIASDWSLSNSFLFEIPLCRTALKCFKSNVRGG